MPFSRQNPSGWATGDLITPAQITGIDVNLSRALDGTGGGSYTPSSPLIISSMQVPSGGTWTVLSGGTWTAAAGSAVIVAGTSAFSGASQFSGAIVRTGSGATYQFRITTASDSNADLDTSFDYYRIPDVATNRDYLLTAPSVNGLQVTLSRIAFAGGNIARIFKIDRSTTANIIAEFPGSGASWATFMSLGGAWTVIAWGGSTTSLG